MRCCLLMGLAILSSCNAGDDAGKFKHTGHVTIAKGSCVPCHGNDPAAPTRPTRKECGACHAKGAQLFAEFQALPVPSRIIPHLPNAYADVLFSHAPHAGAGVPCDGCHALPQGGKKESSFPKMAACKECHEKNGVPVTCPTCHREKR
ncbi:MAG TPA: hypothetical protein VGK27_02375 [Candidatus Deferrimicrobiaceae bacterium]